MAKRDGFGSGRWIAALFICAAGSHCAWAAPAPQPVQYDRDVLPIVSDKCYHCHGPDEKARKAKLRLDTKEGAFGPREAKTLVHTGTGTLRLDNNDVAVRLDNNEVAVRPENDKPVIIPFKSDESELVRRITSVDPEVQMPPPESNRKLSAQQIDVLRRWVDEGAKWGVHWSLLPPKRPPVPDIRQKDWPRNAIDHFVLARLEKEGLRPAQEASKETLIRRVTFDLTGLPPTPGEIDAFLADSSPDAYEKVIDRLLASPRFGERMAADWLDLARYADTHGYQRDRFRPMWAYRDWVISAFNRNLPFDQFVTWQLAGDLLPNATKEQRLATAFNRLHMQNEEGGIVEEEFRVAYNVDRVTTFGTAFLGLTFECSRCHDHKYDPITQRDFYSLFAFFQNIDECGQTTFFTESMPVPTLLLSTDEQDAKLADLHKRISAKEKELQTARTKLKAEFKEWLDSKPPEPQIPGLVAAYSFDEIKSNQSPNSVDPKKPAKAVEGPEIVAGKIGQAAQLSGENGFTFPGVGNFTRADPFSLSIWVQMAEVSPRAVVIHKSKAPVDAGSRGYELLLEDGKVAFGLHHMWPGNSLKVVMQQAIPAGPWVHLAVTYDGSSRASGIRIYVDGADRPFDVIRDGLFKDITYGGGEPDLAIGYRFRDNGFKDGAVDEFRIYDRVLTPLEAAHLAGRTWLAQPWAAAADQLSDKDRAALLDYYLVNVSATGTRLAEELHALRVEQNKLITPIPEAMVMKELPQPKPAYILKRGAYDAPGDPVSMDTPASLPSFPTDAPRNRLGLAQWLLSPDQPLTARVTVNRLWQQMFGRGIVETSDNFGTQGSPPTHPELLDWLAVELREPSVPISVGATPASPASAGARSASPAFSHDPTAGDAGVAPTSAHPWNIKLFLKLIAMSATYRQSSQASPDLLTRDPANDLLGRGPARRLTAEMLRDQALFDAGLLAERLGGPSVKPYQPDGLWDDVMRTEKYDQSHGDDLHRRSLYTYWKRSVPPPTMIAFDAADRSYCTARRQTTSTPLQALALLNDPQITESARFIAQRMLKEGGSSLDERAAWVFRLLNGRKPTDRETTVVRQLYDEQRATFAADPAAAGRLLAVGEAKNDGSLDPSDLAAATVLAEALLNHDGAVMRR